MTDLKAHKTMTPEEYAAMPIAGWHLVCRDYDGLGGTGIRFGAAADMAELNDLRYGATQQLAFQDSPRFRRARRFADTVQSLLRDFLPNDRECVHRINDYLTRMGWEANAEVISVPPEWDAFDKLQIERAMLEAKIAPVLGKIVGGPQTAATGLFGKMGG